MDNLWIIFMNQSVSGSARAIDPNFPELYRSCWQLHLSPLQKGCIFFSDLRSGMECASSSGREILNISSKCFKHWLTSTLLFKLNQTKIFSWHSCVLNGSWGIAWGQHNQMLGSGLRILSTPMYTKNPHGGFHFLLHCAVFGLQIWIHEIVLQHCNTD